MAQAYERIESLNRPHSHEESLSSNAPPNRATSGQDLVNTRWTKVVLAGPPGSGKSSALRLLLDEEPIFHHHSTPVIQSPKVITVETGSDFKWNKVLSTIDDLIGIDSTDSAGSDADYHFIYAIDTGGQAAFLDIAPAFLRHHSVNIITHRLDEKLDGETAFYYSVEGKRIGEPIKRNLTNHQVLELTVRSLTSASPLELDGVLIETVDNRESVDKPSVLVLGTFNDREHGESLEDKQSCLENKLAEFVDFVDYGSRKIFPVNTIDRSAEVQKVASAIRRKISSSYMEAKIPRKWFLFQTELIQRQGDKKAVIAAERQEMHESETTAPEMSPSNANRATNQSLPALTLSKSECDEIGFVLGMSPEDVKLALMYLHDLTIVLYFPNILPNIVFLKPQPLFNKLSELISVSFRDGADNFEKRNIDLPSGAHDNLKNKGLFTKKLLKSEGFMGNILHVNDFLKLLEGLLIVIRLPNSNEKNPQYFLPCVLPTTSNERLVQLRAKYEGAPLVLKWKKAKIPQGLFCALILQLLLSEVFDSFVEKEVYFRNAIQLKGKQFGDLLLVDSIDYLEVYYAGNQLDCYKIQELIYEQLSRAVRRFNYQSHLSQPEMYFFCSSGHVARITEGGTKKTCDKCDRKFDTTERERLWLISSREFSILDGRPCLKELLENIYIPDKLKTLGFLLDLPSNEINHIFQKPDDVDKHPYVFKLWLEVDHKATRRKLIEKLQVENIMERRLAYEYKQKIEQMTQNTGDESTDYNIDANFNVDEIMKYLTQCSFKQYQWFELGKGLKLSDARLEEIEGKFHTSSQCLQECLSLWLEKGEGVPIKTSESLATALEFDDDSRKIAELIRWTEQTSSAKKEVFNISSIMKYLDENNFKRRDWFHLGEELGFSEEELDSIEAKSDDSDEEKLTETLLLWLGTDKGTLPKTLDSIAIAFDILQKSQQKSQEKMTEVSLDAVEKDSNQTHSQPPGDSLHTVSTTETSSLAPAEEETHSQPPGVLDPKTQKECIEHSQLEQSPHATNPQAVADDKEASVKSTAAVLESMTILEQNKALLRDYTVDQIGDLLDKIGLGKYKETFKEMEIDGRTFFDLDDDYLKDPEEFNVKKRFHRDKVMKIVNGVKLVSEYFPCDECKYFTL